jgi:hypothetical protein
MGATALVAEVLKTLEPVRVKITPHSFEYSIGSKRNNQIDAPPQEGAELNIAAESESDITEIKEQSVDAEEDDV